MSFSSQVPLEILSNLKENEDNVIHDFIHSVTADVNMRPTNSTHVAPETFNGYSCLQHRVIKFLSYSALKHCLT